MAFYDKAGSWWGEPRICVRPTPCTDELQKELTIPLCFVRQGGDNSLQFVQHMIQQLYVEDGRLVDAESNDLDLSTEPGAWPDVVYQFIPMNTNVDSLTSVRGPEGKSPLPRPASTQSESTYSDSKRTSSRSGQSKFRTSLLARDGRCLLTQAERSMCTSAHVVPVTRLDVYRMLLGIQSEGQLYSASMGFLIRDDLHKSYDRYEWSWYCKDGKYYPHFFALEDEKMRSLHGMVVDPAIYMRVQPREYLDPRLAKWHYRQCVLARVRGFSCGFDS